MDMTETAVVAVEATPTQDLGLDQDHQGGAKGTVVRDKLTVSMYC